MASIGSLGVGAAAALTALVAGAADTSGSELAYPVRPIRMIVPQAPGSASDTVARLLAAELTQQLRQQVVVDNRPGGALMIGMEMTARALPDGYTIGIMTVEIVMLHHQGLSTLTSASFAHLGLVNADATAIHVRKDAPYKNLGDLMEAIRRNPGKL